jgi:hypothetical protein
MANIFTAAAPAARPAGQSRRAAEPHPPALTPPAGSDVAAASLSPGLRRHKEKEGFHKLPGDSVKYYGAAMASGLQVRVRWWRRHRRAAQRDNWRGERPP